MEKSRREQFLNKFVRRIGPFAIALILVGTITGNSASAAAASLKVEDLGTVLSTNTIDREVMFKLNGEAHILLYYTRLTSTTQSYQIVDVDMDTKSTRLVDA